MPVLPLLDFTRFKACKQLFRSQTSSISCPSLPAGLSDMRFAVGVSVPSREALGASLRPFSSKASFSWFCCRLPPIESRCLLTTSCRLGLQPPGRPIMPAADFCCTVRVDRSTLSPDSRTCSRPPAIRLTAFDAQPPDLPPAPLMVEDFAITCPLVRCRRPHIRFLSIGSRLCSTLPSDPTSR